VKDPQRTWRILTAPGVVTVVAADAGKVVGFAQAMTDGGVAAFLSLLLVAADCRRQGIGRRLVKKVFALTGAERMDLTTDSAPEFYRSFEHHEWHGFRLYPRHSKARRAGRGAGSSARPACPRINGP
jgi:ribosomal protein S18 acetylase RimI-like enzyme